MANEFDKATKIFDVDRNHETMYVLKMITNNRIWKTKRLEPQLRQPPRQHQLQPRLQELHQ